MTLPVPYNPGLPVPFSPTGALGPGAMPPLQVPNLAQQMGAGGGVPYGPPAPTPGFNPMGGGSIGASPEVAAAEAAGLNKFGSLAAKLGVPEQFLGATFMPGMWGGAAASILGHPVGNLVGQMTGSQTAGNTTGDVLQYGGLGASLGSLVGPWGTAAGALGGGAFGLYKGLTTHEAPSVHDQAFKMLSGFGVDSQVQGTIKQTYEQLKNANPQMADQWLSGVVNQAGQSFQTQANPFQQQQSQEQNLVLQQLAGQAMSPYVQDMRTNADAAAKSLSDNLGHNLSARQADQLRPLVKQYTALSKNVGDAYALQAQAFPIQNQLAKSAWSNMIQQASGSGGGGLTALLAQQASATPTK